MIKKRAKLYELDSLLTLMLTLWIVSYLLIVVPLGLEPRLFCTKNRRVASYTMGQKRSANLIDFFKNKQTFILFFFIFILKVQRLHIEKAENLFDFYFQVLF